MKKHIIFVLIGFSCLLFSCSKDSSDGNVNKVSFKVNGVKQPINATYTLDTNDDGIVTIEGQYIRFDYPTEGVSFEVDTNGAGANQVSNFKFQNGNGFFYPNDSFTSSVAVDASQRTISGTFSGTVVSDFEPISTLSLTAGSFFVHY